jgi:hypothetical protein
MFCLPFSYLHQNIKNFHFPCCLVSMWQKVSQAGSALYLVPRGSDRMLVKLRYVFHYFLNIIWIVKSKRMPIVTYVIKQQLFVYKIWILVVIIYKSGEVILEICVKVTTYNKALVLFLMHSTHWNTLVSPHTILSPMSYSLRILITPSSVAGNKIQNTWCRL